MVSYAYRDAAAQTVSTKKVAISPSDELTYPFGELAVDFTQSELREAAYEILVGACRSFNSGKTLKYVSSSVKSSTSSSSSKAASKVKKALGLKKNLESVSGKKASTVGVAELMRVQMGISEPTDTRVRRAFLRVAAGQVYTTLFVPSLIDFNFFLLPPKLGILLGKAKETLTNLQQQTDDLSSIIYILGILLIIDWLRIDSMEGESFYLLMRCMLSYLNLMDSFKRNSIYTIDQYSTAMFFMLLLSD